MIVCNICKTEIKDSEERYLLPIHDRKEVRGGSENSIMFALPTIMPKESHLCENCKCFIADLIKVMQNEPKLYDASVKKELIITQLA